MKKYVFLILHYISIDDTIKCINSIQELYKNVKYEIVVVDNGSKNNTGIELKNKYAKDNQIHIILSKENLGFAKGNNLGFKYIKEKFNPDYIIMINNDIVMIDKKLCEKIDEDYQKYQFSVLGPKIILKDGCICNYNQKLPTVKQQKKRIAYLYFRLILNYLYFNKIIEKYRFLKKQKKSKINNPTFKENIILHGSILIFSKEYISKFDGIDDRTFLYCEEELLYLRLLKNNLKTIYDPNIFVIHNEDAATNISNKNNRKKNIFVDKELIKSNKILLKTLQNEKIKINFYLPGVYKRIIGGYKTVYQYANYLSKKYDVMIYFNLNDGKNNKHIPKKIMILLKKIMILIEPRWFKLSPNVKKKAIKFEKKIVRKAHINIATAAETSKFVNSLDGKKIYFIQGYENWDMSENDLHKTYNYDMKKIVIASWLKKLVDKNSSEKSIIVSNGIDLNKFKLINRIEDRKQLSICMMYHKSKLKACDEGLKIIEKLKNDFPELEVRMFGSPKRPKNMPKYIEYKRNASEEDVINILNKSSVFLFPSKKEGFGLPGLESMVCGCVLISMDCDGIKEYANKFNSIIVKNLDYNEMYKQTYKILKDEKRRINIAKEAQKIIKIWDLNLKCEIFKQEIFK